MVLLLSHNLMKYSGIQFRSARLHFYHQNACSRPSKILPYGERKGKRSDVVTYLASHFVVVQVHERPGILFDLSGVHEHLGEAQAVADVC